VREYLDLLRRADEWYRGVKAKHPDRVPCTRGCRECCLGLFDITQADRDFLREGMAALDPAARSDIEERAAAILDRLRATHPALGETLDGWGPAEIDDLCDALGPVECPVLGPHGECRLYAHRPLTCRLSGVPVVDLSGEVVQGEGCSKCTLRAGDTPRLDCEGLRREERRILRHRYPGRAGVPLLIPQAVASPPGRAGRG
jgi:Fe-S-cluster containining protein